MALGAKYFHLLASVPPPKGSTAVTAAPGLGSWMGGSVNRAWLCLAGRVLILHPLSHCRGGDTLPTKGSLKPRASVAHSSAQRKCRQEGALSCLQLGNARGPWHAPRLVPCPVCLQ